MALTFIILEAHPVENEDFKNQFMQIKTHQSLGDRLEAASKIQTMNEKPFLVCMILIFCSDELLQLEELPGPFLVDNMKDEASDAYGAHPERLYIILDGKIVYQVSQQ